MSDCGCGSSDGNCTDNLNDNSKNAQVTGNINYDGSPSTCANKPGINVATGENLNAILQKMLAAICPLDSAGSKLVWNKSGSGGNAVGMGVTQQIADMFKLEQSSGSTSYKGQGVRLRFALNTNNATLIANAFMKLEIYGNDGTSTQADFLLVNATLPSGSTARSFLLTYEFYRDTTNVTTNKIFGYWKLESDDGSVTNGSMGFEATVPWSLTDNNIGFKFTAGSGNVADYLYMNQMTVEHLK